MYFELSILIERPQADVFAFLRDKDLYPQEKGSPVLILEKTTSGPVALGTGYREVVQMLPFARGEICSKITRFEPWEYLAEDFWGAGMYGHLEYQFVPEADGTSLFQRETLDVRWFLKPFEFFFKRALDWRLPSRLEDIKRVLESGWEVELERIE
ncbi:MAG: SRPBCC family protein [Anaerolineales bacterium]|nr:SRPBCC family protein [Chloroflexota bacterium]MBL6983642.1 SRPBCC family protein [Anaerolineales bacterium]